ncbi:MAG: PAS domain S-box protein, partial [Legionella sp.]|nr:PAS domain S-box protein [Legionella sp.]
MSDKPFPHQSSSADLREQEAWLRCILETVPDAIIVIDKEKIIQSFSPAAERQFGYGAGEVIG